MRDPDALPMPDYNSMAGDFDRYLPLIHPVSLALLDHLPALASGALVLDVACGTGEPGLTLARRAPETRLLGVDSAAVMLAVAQRKAAQEALSNVRFEVMPSESIKLADESVDAVISRFGLLLFGDVPASARELVRVLRPGGHFSIAVWDDPAKNTLVNTMMTLISAHLPSDHVSPAERLKEWSADGARTRLLQDAGLGVVRSEMYSWMYRFADFEEAWDLLSRMGSFTGQAVLSAETQQDVKRELSASLTPYRQAAGEYVIPHACRLIWGQR